MGDHALLILLSVASLSLLPGAMPLQPSQAWSLFKLRQLLGDPPVLGTWRNYTDFCYGGDYKTASAFVECYEDSVTQLHIMGEPGARPLPTTFSIDAFFTTLSRLPDLKVLTLTNLGLWGPLPGGKISRLQKLEIVNVSSNYLYGELPRGLSQLGSLQTLVADHNMLGGKLPGWLKDMPLLAVLSLRNNTLQGTLPESLKDMPSLRSLVLASNNLSGNLPELSNLQVIDMANNALGPKFPRLGRKVASVVLAGNKFSDGLPADMLASCYLLERLDVSGNRFTGRLSGNASCGENLRFVDLSSNLLTGSLPGCLLAAPGKTVLFSANCLSTGDDSQSQHPSPFCRNQALAVGIVPEQGRKKSGAKAGVVAVIVLVGALVVSAAVVFVVRKARLPKARPARRLVEHASSAYPSNLLADARYISQTVKLGALGIPAYRSFSLVELEAATDNFQVSSLMGQDAHGQMYRGRLSNGTPVTIRSLKVNKSQSFTRHIEMISKLRHRHLVSALGHCFQYNLDDSTVTHLYLVFEYVHNGNLRGRISQGTEGRKLSWGQRISTAIGVAKGIQFLHGGIIPGLFANNLKITNILMDQNQVPKIGSYNIPILSETMKSEGGAGSKYPPDRICRVPNGDKIDMYDFGVILLEVISGRPISSLYEVEMMKEQLQSALTAQGPSKRSNLVDPAVSKACSDDSMRTVMEICLRCLAKEPTQRPSVEDVLWNLQFAAQVQDDSRSSEESPLSPSQPHAQSAHD
ncbi:hypothetical protein VPH35_020883 [Triticum aestivum]